jgi:amino acid permease
LGSKSCSQVRRALGRKLALALSATLMLYQLGSCAAYLIIVGDTFGSLIAQACSLRYQAHQCFMSAPIAMHTTP